MVTKLKNTIRYYTNGLAQIIRVVEVPPTGVGITIECKERHLSDIISSYAKEGPIFEVRPPSFVPKDSTKGMQIAPDLHIAQILAKLSGCEMQIETFVAQNSLPSCRIVASHYVPMVQFDDKAFSEDASTLVVYSDKIIAMAFTAIRSFTFKDINAQQEFDFALKANYKRIKPDNTVLSLEMASSAPTTVTGSYTYTIPVPQSPCVYQFTFYEAGKPGTLFGKVVIHNDSNEDWKEENLEILVGTPLTAESNLNEKRLPIREKVSFLSNSAAAPFQVEDSLDDGDLECISGGVPAPASFGAMSRNAEMALHSSGRVASHLAQPKLPAKVDIDDFAMFQCEQPLSLSNNTAAVVSIIEETLPVKKVLLWDQTKHATRPFRALVITNNGKQTLPFGSMTAYELSQGVNVKVLLGHSLIWPSTKVNDNAIVVYAADSANKIVAKTANKLSVLNSVTIKNGVVSYHSTDTVWTEYHIDARGTDATHLYLEHPRKLEESSLEVADSDVIQEATPNGFRLVISNPGERARTVRVAERSVQIQTCTFDSAWVNRYVLSKQARLPSLSTKSGMTDYINKLKEHQDMLAKVKSIQNNLNEAKGKNARANAALVNLRTDEERARYLQILNDSESEINNITANILPAAEKRLSDLSDELASLQEGVAIVMSADESTHLS